MTGTTFNANQELIGQGVANIASSFLGGLPATGAIARPAASIENGAKSPLAGMFQALFLLIMYFALMDVVKYIPLAVFASILISVSINMSRFPLFIKLTRFGVRDVIILVVTFALTIVFDLTYGVIGGMVVTFIANARSIKIGLKIDAVEDGELAVKGCLFFMNTNKLIDVIQSQFDRVDVVTLDFNELESIAQTAMEKLKTFDSKCVSLGKKIICINLNQKTQNRFDKYYDFF